MKIFQRMNLVTSFLAIAFTVLFFLSSTIYAEWYIEHKQKIKSGDKPETVSIQKMYIKEKMMKIEMDTDNRSQFIRLDKDVLWMVDHDKKTYHEVKITPMLQSGL